MAKDKDDPMLPIYEKADCYSEVYTNDPFWKSMKAGCDAIREEKTSQAVLDQVDKEYRCWGAQTSNKDVLGKVLSALKKCEVV